MTSTHLGSVASALTPGTVPLGLVSISATADGAVFAADTSGAVYCQGVAPEGWIAEPGQLESIAAASDGTVIGLSSGGELVELASGSWQPISPAPPTPSARIAVGNAQCIWGTASDGTPMSFDGSSWTSHQGFAAMQLSAGSDGSVFALDHAGAIYQPSGSGWTQIAAPEAMAWISGAQAGWLWAIDGQGNLYQWDGSEGWPQISAPVGLKAVACGDDGTVWAQDTAGVLYSYVGDAWETLPSPSAVAVVAFSVGCAAQTWAVDGNNDVFYYGTDESWQLLSATAAAVCVSASSSTDLWYLTRGQEIFRSQGRQWSPVQVPGGLTNISAAADGTVWGVSSNREVFSYGTSGWTQMPGTLTQIAVGSAQLVFGIDDAGAVWQFNSGVLSGLTGPGPAVTDLAVSSDGPLWATDASGNLYLYTDGTPPWLTCGTGLKQVSGGSSANVWGINESGQAVAISDGSSPVGEGSTRVSVGASRLRWETENPFDETDSTHLWIVNRAAALAGNAGGPDGAAIAARVQPYVGKIGDNGFHDNLCQGLYDADFKPPYNDPMVGKYRPMYYSHFYNPDTGESYNGESDPTALTRGRSCAAYALDCYYAGDMADAGYNLGLALHYLTDLTQPMHAANLSWFSSVPFGWHSEFESRVMLSQATVSAPTTLQPNASDVLDSYFIGAAQVTKPQAGLVWPQAANSGAWYVATDQTWAQVAPAVPGLLQFAIGAAAQFLIAWMRLAQQEGSTCAIVSGGSGLVVEVPMPMLGPLDQDTLNGSKFQQWVLAPLPAPDTGFYRISSLGVPGMVFDVKGASKAANAIVQPDQWKGQSSQKWRLVNAPLGAFKIENQNSGMLLTVSNLSKKGSALVQQPQTGSPAQNWFLTPVEPVVFTSTAAALVLDVPGKSNSAGKALQMYTSTGGRNQQWQLVPMLQPEGGTDDLVYAILSLQSGLALAAAGMTVVQTTWNGSSAQLWLQVEETSGSVFSNLGVPGAVLTAAGMTKGSAVVLQSDTGAALQRWSL
jgi:hypothetical protein